MINAVIFDMDGILINTEKYLFQCWKQATMEAGFTLNREQLLRFRSFSQEFAAPYFQELFGEGFDYPAIRDRRRELMDAHILEHGVEKKPGAEKLLSWLTAHGIKKAVATASSMEKTKEYLTQIGIFDDFDEIVCAPDVPHGKPMPDVYLSACDQIGEKPQSCVALEDSDNGALSAYRAGCRVIMVPDLAPPLSKTAEFLTGIADHLEAVIPILENMGVGR